MLDLISDYLCITQSTSGGVEIKERADKPQITEKSIPKTILLGNQT